MSVQVEPEIILSLIISYSARLVYQFVLATTKIAILTLYLRVFTDSRSLCLVYGMLVFMILYNIPSVFLMIFECNPVSDSWNPNKFPHACKNVPIQVYMSAGFNILLDVMMVIFAVPRVCMSPLYFSIYAGWRSNLRLIAVPLKLLKLQKVALIAIASLSSLVIIASIIRLIRLTAVSSSTDPTCTFPCLI